MGLIVFAAVVHMLFLNECSDRLRVFQDEGHSDWVSCVRFSPNHHNPIIVSAGWDRMVKVCFFVIFGFTQMCKVYSVLEYI